MLTGDCPLRPLDEPTLQVETTPVPLDPLALGEEIFLNVPPEAGPQALWCYQCHQIDGLSAGKIGPNLTDIGTAAATRKPGMSAEEYIRESIVDPDVFVPEVPRNTQGLMTKAVTGGLTKEQVDGLVAFLLAQE